MASSPDNNTPSDSTAPESTPASDDNSTPSSPPENSSPPPSPPANSSPPPSSPPPSPSSPPPPSPDNSSSSPPTPPGKTTPSPPTPPVFSPPPLTSTPTTPNASPPPPASKSPPSGTPVSPPPPPASRSTSPPPPSGSSNSATSDSSSGSSAPSESPSSSSSPSGISTIAIGVAAGLGVLLIGLLVLCIVCYRRRKRRSEDVQYYGDGPKGSHDYFNSSAQQQGWKNSPYMTDHVVRLNGGTPGGSGAPWPPPPPQPPLSGEMTSSSGPNGVPLPPPSPSYALGFNKSTFTYDELAAATNGFSQTNLLGQGGFGYVHKGVLPNGKEVAVKSLKSGSGQGEREFQAEVDIISRVHHRHLVSLVGYCIASGQRMLVYEFVPNGTLEHHLHAKGLPVMDWPARLRIAVGMAKGLAYLHEDCHPRIIHRDIKSANILLDNNFEAMVADFGLAKLSSDNFTHVSTRVMGTFGYLAPEYASSGKLTDKSDVFSFGVMLLELITGKQPVDTTNVMEDSLVDWARPLMSRALGDGNYQQLADIRLEGNYNPQEMAHLVASAAACIRHSARKRPKMSQIVRALEGDVSLEDLNEGVRPGQSSVFPAGSRDYDSNAYNADMKRFRKIALESEEFPSGEHGASSTSNESDETG